LTVSNNEPKFIKSNTSLANSRSELDVYAEMNDYLDKETKGRLPRAQSYDILTLDEEESSIPAPISPLPTR
jgi:hypothetical protein